MLFNNAELDDLQGEITEAYEELVGYEDQCRASQIAVNKKELHALMLVYFKKHDDMKAFLREYWRDINQRDICSGTIWCSCNKCDPSQKSVKTAKTCQKNENK